MLREWKRNTEENRLDEDCLVFIGNGSVIKQPINQVVM